jgi:hypothetical protein
VGGLISTAYPYVFLCLPSSNSSACSAYSPHGRELGARWGARAATRDAGAGGARVACAGSVSAGAPVAAGGLPWAVELPTLCSCVLALLYCFPCSVPSAPPL